MNIIDLSDRTNMFYWMTNRKITPEQFIEIFRKRFKTADKAEAIAAAEYGLQKYGLSVKAESIGDWFSSGSVNTSARVKLEDGSEVLIRLHPKHVKNGYFWVEKEVTNEARKHGVKTFETYWVEDSFDKFTSNFILISALEGTDMKAYGKVSTELDAKLVFEIGENTAKLHQSRVKGFGFFRNDIAKNEGRLQGQYDSFAEHIFAGLDEDLEFLVKHKVFTQKQADQCRVILEEHSDLYELEEATIVHNDIADWNVMTNGKEITGLIDWDESFAGDPVMDFAQWSLFFDDARTEHFIAGYNSVSPLPEKYEEKLHLFRLRYVICKLHLRQKRALVEDSEQLQINIKRGLDVMKEEFKYFGI